MFCLHKYQKNLSRSQKNSRIHQVESDSQICFPSHTPPSLNPFFFFSQRLRLTNRVSGKVNCFCCQSCRKFLLLVLVRGICLSKKSWLPYGHINTHALICLPFPSSFSHAVFQDNKQCFEKSDHLEKSTFL